MDVKLLSVFCSTHFIGLLYSDKFYCRKVTLNPNGIIQICRNPSTTAKESSMHLACVTKASSLVWIFTNGKNDSSRIIKFVHGGSSHPVDVISGVWAVLISQSKEKMASNLTVLSTASIMPFEVSCGINFNEYQSLSMTYKGTVISLTALFCIVISQSFLCFFFFFV